MIARFQWAWHELTRPRGRSSRRFHRVGRRSRAGVALLMVVASILLLTILVTEIARGAAVRMQLAQHHRDEARAEALATSGVQMYRLILMASKQMGSNPMIQQFGPMLGTNGDSLWQLVPAINTQLMRMIFVTGGDADEFDEVTEEQLDESRQQSSAFKRNFLDFDGDFQASIVDEDQFIFVGKFDAADTDALQQKPVTQQLLGLMAGEETTDWLYDNNIEKLELISNLVDWTDLDDLRLYEGGREDSLYENLESPYRSKNAPFDTREEIRLVDGWHLDGVWERIGKNLTIYGGGKVNVNTAKPDVIGALFRGYSVQPMTDDLAMEYVKLYMQARNLSVLEGGVYFQQPSQFTEFVTNTLNLQLREEVTQAVSTESSTFRVTSVGEVGDSRVELEVVLDYNTDPTGSVLYWSSK